MCHGVQKSILFYTLYLKYVKCKTPVKTGIGPLGEKYSWKHSKQTDKRKKKKRSKDITWNSTKGQQMLTDQVNVVNSEENQSNIVHSEEKYGAETLLDLLPSHNPSSLTQLCAQIERWKDSKRKRLSEIGSYMR